MDSELIEVEGPKYENKSVVSIVPTRGFVHCLAAQSYCNLQYPINHKHRGPLFVMGMEVDAAYEGAVQQIVDKMGDYAYILTMEDDMAIPSMALLMLVDAIGEYDGISACYTRKKPNSPPHIYGDPNVPGDWSPLEVDLEKQEVVECNAIPMGFSLYKMSLFKDVSKPWFKSEQMVEDGERKRISQDLYFCMKAREAGKRFAVHCGVQCGHIDNDKGLMFFPGGRVTTLYGKEVDDAIDG